MKAEGFSQIAFQDNHGESAAPLIFQETRAVSPAQWMQGPAGGVGIYVPMVHWHGPGGRAGAAAGQRCIPHVWSRPTGDVMGASCRGVAQVVPSAWNAETKGRSLSTGASGPC